MCRRWHRDFKSMCNRSTNTWASTHMDKENVQRERERERARGSGKKTTEKAKSLHHIEQDTGSPHPTPLLWPPKRSVSASPNGGRERQMIKSLWQPSSHATAQTGPLQGAAMGDGAPSPGVTKPHAPAEIERESRTDREGGREGWRDREGCGGGVEKRRRAGLWLSGSARQHTAGYWSVPDMLTHGCVCCLLLEVAVFCVDKGLRLYSVLIASKRNTGNCHQNADLQTGKQALQGLSQCRTMDLLYPVPPSGPSDTLCASQDRRCLQSLVLRWTFGRDAKP